MTIHVEQLYIKYQQRYSFRKDGLFQNPLHLLKMDQFSFAPPHGGCLVPAAKLLPTLWASLSCQVRKLTFFLLFAWAFRKGSWTGTWGKGSTADPVRERREKKSHKDRKNTPPNQNHKVNKKNNKWKIIRGMKLLEAIEIALSHWFKRIILSKGFAIELRAIPWRKLEFGKVIEYLSLSGS